MQIMSFRNKGLERVVKTGDPSGIRICHANRLRSIIKGIRSVRFPGELIQGGNHQFYPIPRLRLNQQMAKDIWSCRVSGNWRLIFRVDQNQVFDMDYLDYH